MPHRPAPPELPLDLAPRHLVLPRARIVGVLTAVAVLLAVASAAVTILRLVYGRDYVFGLSTLLDLNYESNLPTWFQGSVLLLGALTAAVIAWLRAAAKAPDVRQWSALAALIALLSADEVAALHEHFTIPKRYLGQYGSVHNFTWVFLGVIVAGGVAALFLRFVLELPARTRNGILLAGAIYLTGAAGFEAIGGIWALGHGEKNLVYAAFTTIEESLEMAGQLLLLATLLDYLATLGAWQAEVR